MTSLVDMKLENLSKPDWDKSFGASFGSIGHEVLKCRELSSLGYSDIGKFDEFIEVFSGCASFGLGGCTSDRNSMYILHCLFTDLIIRVQLSDRKA